MNHKETEFLEITFLGGTMAYEYVKQYYGVKVEPGDRVRMKSIDGKEGTVARKRTYDQYVHVKFDGRNFDVPVHPLDLVYLGNKG